MRLALIHHQLATGGGMESYLLELINAAHAAGHQIDLFVMKRDPKIILPEGVEVRVIPSLVYPRFLRKYCFARKLKKILLDSACQSYDRVISTTRSFSQDILITGGTHRGYMRACKRHGWRDYVEAFLEARAYRSAKKIIAHSPALQSELIHLYGIAAHKITMLYPPVDVRAFQFQKKQAHGGPLRLVFASTSHKRKGGFLLLNALKMLPQDQFELTVLGKPFKQAAKYPNIQCLGYVQNIADYFHQADWVVLPSYFEPFGLVVVQALECGTPVIVSQCSGAAALVGSGEGLILTQQNAAELAILLQQAQQMQCQIKPGFAARHDLNWDAHLQALLGPC
jgi:glycosyltransferase involved in cell wall biosynthesis